MKISEHNIKGFLLCKHFKIYLQHLIKITENFDIKILKGK